MSKDDSRNPVILFDKSEEPVTALSCPKCGCKDYYGRNVQGSITWTCGDPKCLHKWAGGQQAPVDTTRPMPPMNPADRPSVSFTKDSKGQVEEIRRPVSSVPDFRKGVPIPSGEE